ncbi:amino acid adenylation domain-containing protein [Novosphingobium sp.]|uniref:non-ribosomal peptide synthetase n=1 Tax=Novosphingobium sp. TaxID=1874826 RepID=UPI003BADB060
MFTASEVRPALLHAFLAEAAARYPDGTAIEVPPARTRPERQVMTYAELAALTDRLAQHLAPRLEAERIVALLLPRTSPMLYVAQIAVLKAGGAYTAIDPSFPDDRIAEVLEDADAVAVLTDAAGAERLEPFAGAVPLLLAAELARQEPPTGAVLPEEVRPDQLAYVIYTSGTTGKPKGVMVEHCNVANLVASDLGEFGLTPADRVIQGSSAAYDSSIEEIWLALASGATLVVMDDETARLGPDIVEWLRRERASVFCPPPTLLRSSGCRDPEAALPDLKLLYVGGEALPRDIADRWARGRRMVNGYGPTECAVTCLRGDILPGGPITIGRPVPGMQAFVLDDALQPVREGEQGELCMGGAGVARGYRHREDLTAEKFVDHPICGRIYRTGDLVHREPDGNLFYHGRIDAQVKIRGYRVELGEIEARLAALPGVRAAAARLQDAGGVPELVAYVVPGEGVEALDLEDLRSQLSSTVPGYMVPRRIGMLAELPTTVGGKLNRAALPPMTFTADAAPTRAVVPPATPLETALAAAVADILNQPHGVSVEDDFFEDLGGDSLSAALLVTLLREEGAADWVTVSDIYAARSVRALAALGEEANAAAANAAQHPALELTRKGKARPVLAGIVQTAWLAGELAFGGWVSWAVAWELFPLLFDKLDLVAFVLLTPLITVAGVALYLPVSVGFTLLVKRIAIGRYRPVRAPVWSTYYLRHWVTVQSARLIPWPMLSGTVFQNGVLRLLGAKIGRGVHIHRGVHLHRGGWDLLEIGDNATLGQDAHLGLVELDRGDIVVGPIVIGADATLQTRASVEHDCRVGASSVIAPLSVLNAGGTIPPGELWDGVPARRVGPAPAAPALTESGLRLSPVVHGLVTLAAEGTATIVGALPTGLLALLLCYLLGVGSNEIWTWIYDPKLDPQVLAVVFGVTVVSVPVSLIWSALMVRAMGRVQAGVIDRWSLAYIRVWLKSAATFNAGQWLSGTLFWKEWLRLAGANIGEKCEISTIFDVTPELVTIGAETFFADGIYLGGPEITRGTVRLEPIVLGRNTFLGNHAVIPAGEVLPDDILIGISTVANAAEISAGQSRFGRPSFDLPRRQVVEMDRSLTHDPSLIRYINRVFWELLRFVLPVGTLLATVLWYKLLVEGAPESTDLEFALIVIPLATLMPLVALLLAVTVLKWTLMGRVKPGQHALWSCWASRWDFVFVAWARYANAILQQLEGTFLLTAYLRLMGLKIGKGAVLGPQFSQVVDPDMIEIGDGATVTAFFQAHTFEDRVLKVDKVRIMAGATVSAGTVPLYGCLVGEGAHVGPGSVIMKQESLLPGLSYQGVPLKVVRN